MHRALTRFRVFILACSLLTAATMSVLTVHSAPAQLPPVGIIYVDASATGANSGSTWTDAFTSLDSAINAAAAGDFILVAAGTYTQAAWTPDGYTITKALNIYGGFAGGETSIDTRAGLFSATILDGASISRLFTITGVGGSNKVVIDGFHLKDGSARGAASVGPNKGGGIYAEGSNLNLGNCIFDQTSASGGDGGGIYFTGAAGSPNTLNIKYCQFLQNMVEYKGGAIYGAFLTAGDVVNSLFDGCWARTEHGGAIYLEEMTPSAPLWLTNCIFWSNYSQGASGKGGALDLGIGPAPGGTGGSAKLINCTMVRNSVPTCGNGQAVNIDVGASCEVHNTIIWHNLGCGGVPPIMGFVPGSVTYSCIQYFPLGPAYPTVVNGDPLFRSLTSPLTLHLLGPGQAGPANPLGSPCIDFADASKLPPDNLDVNEDGLTGNQLMPVNFLGSIRDKDWPGSPNNGIPQFPQPTYVDMGAFEKQ